MEMFRPSDIVEIENNLGETLNKLSGKTILLTGAGGFLGRYFMELFRSHNRKEACNPIRVIALDSFVVAPEQKQQPRVEKDENIEWIYGDASIGADYPERFNFIIHAAGIASPEHYRAHPLETIDVAVNVTRKLLDRAKKDQAKMLFFSSSEIYGDPDKNFIPTAEEYNGYVSVRGPRSCYDESKRLGETLCWIYENYFNVHVCVVRPFNIYGPGMLPKDFRVLPNFASSISNGEPLKVYGHGKQTRTFCYITDAMTGFCKVLLESEKPGVWNVGNPTPEISIFDLALKIKNEIFPQTLIELVTYPEAYPDEEPNRRCPDIHKIESEIGYSPKISLSEGLARFFEWSQGTYSSFHR